MKLKHLMMVGLMLAVLTIGAASAADVADELELADDAADAVSQTDEVDIIAAEDDSDDEIAQENLSRGCLDEVGGDESKLEPSDFEVNITGDLNLDDVDLNDLTLVSIKAPKTATSGYMSINDISIYYSLDECKDGIFTLKYSDFRHNPLKIGVNEITVYYYDFEETLAYKSFNVNKTITNDDFKIEYYDDLTYLNSGLFNIVPPVNGTLTVYVNGSKAHTRFIGEYDYTYVDTGSLNITEYGLYHIAATFTDENNVSYDLLDFL